MTKVGNMNQRFVEWFRCYSPFSEEATALINISNDIVASDNVNCNYAFERGLDAASKIDNIQFSDVKLGNKDKAMTMSSSICSIKCREKVVEINPLQLFHRICCAIEDREEMEEYLSFELTQQPPSLHAFFISTSKSQ